jgi:hypothetical protein
VRLKLRYLIIDYAGVQGFFLFFSKRKRSASFKDGFRLTERRRVWKQGTI